MNIAFVTGWGVFPQNGGQGGFCSQLAAGLIALGHDVSIVTRNAAQWMEWAASRPQLARGMRIVPPSLSALSGADLVHLSKPGLRMLACGFLLRKPIVVTHHDYHAQCPATTAWSPHGNCGVTPGGLGPCTNCTSPAPGSHLRLRVQQWFLTRAVNVGVSRCTADHLGIEHAILNPFDANESPDFCDAEVEPRIAFVGRLVPEKGLDTVITALRRLPGVTLDVYGDGPARSSLEALAQSLNVQSQVCFRGRQANPISQIRTAAAVVVPSLFEDPCAYVVLEAMAAGKAVIAAATGGSPELLQGRGWIVPPSDAEAVAAAVREILDSPGERIARGRAARRFLLDQLAPVDVARRYEAVYRLAHAGG